MFDWHETTRRTVCRAAFLALCILPTCGVVAWSAWHHLPGRVRDYEQRFSRQLGLKVSLRGYSTPRPGVMVLHGIELADPEFGTPLARIDRLELLPEQASDVTLLVAGRADIERDALARLWELVTTQLQRTTSQRVRFLLGEAVCDTPGEAVRLHDLQAQLEPIEAGSLFSLGGRLTGVETGDLILLRAQRNRAVAPPQVAWELDTAGGTLPCGLAAALIPEVARLGPASRFRGVVWARQTPVGWSGELAGEVTAVDAKTLLAESPLRGLTGEARFVVHRGQFHEGRLEHATVSVFGGPGEISRALILEARDRLGLSLEINPEVLKESEGYDQLAFAFRLDASGLHVKGLCETAAPGAVLVSRWGTVLSESQFGPITIADLVRRLSGMLTQARDPFSIPLTAETMRLARRLPAPPRTEVAAGP